MVPSAPGKEGGVGKATLQTLHTLPSLWVCVPLQLAGLELKLHVCNVPQPQRGSRDVHPPQASSTWI